MAPLAVDVLTFLAFQAFFLCFQGLSGFKAFLGVGLQYKDYAPAAWRRRAADRALAAAQPILAVMFAIGFLVKQRWVMSALWCVPGTMQARAISDGFLEARGEPDNRAHASTRYLRAFDHGMMALYHGMRMWYTHALFGVQGHSGEVAAAWIVMTWWWFFEAAFQDSAVDWVTPDRFQAESGRCRLTATRGLAWSQLAIAWYYLSGGFNMGYSDRVWHVPVLGSFRRFRWRRWRLLLAGGAWVVPAGGAVVLGVSGTAAHGENAVLPQRV
jgi:hypothetical protein